MKSLSLFLSVFALIPFFSAFGNQSALKVVDDFYGMESKFKAYTGKIRCLDQDNRCPDIVYSKMEAKIAELWRSVLTDPVLKENLSFFNDNHLPCDATFFASKPDGLTLKKQSFTVLGTGDTVGAVFEFMASGATRSYSFVMDDPMAEADMVYRSVANVSPTRNEFNRQAESVGLDKVLVVESCQKLTFYLKKTSVGWRISQFDIKDLSAKLRFE